MEPKQYVIYHNNAQAYWCENIEIDDDGFTAPSKDVATKFDFSTANKKAFFFGHNVEVVEV